MSLTPEETEVLISSLAAAAAVVLGGWKWYVARKGLVDMGLVALSFAATKVAERTDNKVDDKFALFFASLTGQVEQKGKKPVSEAKARALFDKLQGGK